MAPMNPVTFRLIVFNSPPIFTWPSGNEDSGNEVAWNEEEARKKFEEDALIRREKFKEDAAKAGYNDIVKYHDDLRKKDPRYLKVVARLYQECAAKRGAESTECKFYEKRWLECKAAQNGNEDSGNEVAWNEEEARKKFEEDALIRREKFKEDAAKAGYNDIVKYHDDLRKKDPRYLKVVARLYQECAAKRGAESTECKFYEKRWLECKAAQNA